MYSSILPNIQIVQLLYLLGNAIQSFPIWVTLELLYLLVSNPFSPLLLSLPSIIPSQSISICQYIKNDVYRAYPRPLTAPCHITK